VAARLGERRFGMWRRVGCCVLGFAVIVHALVTPNSHTDFEIFAGLVLLGLVPIDAWLDRYLPNRHGDDDDPDDPGANLEPGHTDGGKQNGTH
jgi:hypothetical protein